MIKKILLIVGALLIAGLIAAGSFWGGMTYQTRKVSQAQANFFAARGGDPGQIPQGGQFPPGVEGRNEGGFPQAGGQNQGFFGGRGTVGQVKSIEGNLMTLSTAQDVTTVNLTEGTVIQKTVSGSTQDLQPGTRVTVTGEQADDGSITASRISILNGDVPDFGGPPPATPQP